VQNHDFFVVIVHYSNESALAKSIANLRLFVDDQHICVVDNSKSLSSDDYSNYLSLDNPGFGAAMNVGVEVMRKKYPSIKYGLLMSHETLISETSIAELLEAAQVERNVAAVGPVLKINEDTYWSFGGDFNRFGLFPKNMKSPHSSNTVDWLDGACTLVDIDTYMEIGGYPEEYFIYVEDVAFGYKVKAVGKKITIASKASAFQTPGIGSRFYDIRNQIILSVNYRSRVHTFCLLFLYSLSIVKSFIKNDRAQLKETAAAIQSAFAKRK